MDLSHRACLIAALALAISACSRPAPPPQADTDGDAATTETAAAPAQLPPPDVMARMGTAELHLQCGEHRVHFSRLDDRFSLRVGDESFPLQPAESTMGARFEATTDPTTTFWEFDGSALVVLRGEELPECIPSLPVETPQN